ncbi:fimbria/pilus periplasmic chaperone [Acinetobacter sp. S40]|uniref:fimbrial biogenesis chaperone n=1 Tax=unclassified Acinetobacter TaxID=196816 RepID=UPI00190A2749|nr:MULTISPECIES: fimbria/pilus periplasmic chaperone [unclassified Acinetobacter]MBJ9983884.1 fimbria/pilus periplasmic chaperone [Acinetobacter sp. S40]MBK0063583.1 fimbria/pilus periplasmic chaperone [Acinetobacter sp. S55]MBK0065346.1 fimbria/pilus periplasmic chaperone [Acinetobacter sp. S54]
MLNSTLRGGLLAKLLCTTALISMSAQSAVTLDRTRIIFPGTEKSINVTISNDNPEEAYLAQSWIEDLQGNKLTKGAILATPPLQRVEASKKSLVRLSTTPEVAKLPQDRESTFYFNLREVPPKPATGNTLQIALQSRVKLFYRPSSILAEAETQWQHKVTLTKTAKGYLLNNPTPFNLTVIGFGNSKEQAEKNAFNAVMVAPKSTHEITSAALATPHLTYINDYGGKPTMFFNCQGETCTVKGE